MKRLSMLLAGSALAMSASAVDWLDASESESGSSFSLDLDSIESSDIKVLDDYKGKYISVFINGTYSADNKYRQEHGAYYDNQQLLISCKDASYYRRAYVNYGPNNKAIKSWQSEKPILTSTDFKLTSPKTVGRTIIEQTCSYYKQAK